MDPNSYLTERRFWNLIQRTLASSTDSFPRPHQQEQSLVAELRRLNRTELVGFLGHYWRLHRKAYRNDLKVVAYVVMGGCSDDCFMDFRNWLVTRGKATYDAALESADSLADVFSRISKGDVP